MYWMECLQSIAPILFVIGALLILVAILSFWLRTVSVYLAFIAILGGVFGVILPHIEVEREVVRLGVSVLAVFGGIVYLLLLSLLALRRLRMERKKRRAELARRLQYTLPQRENTYIRTRLNTALQTSGEGEERELQLAVQLRYTQILLGKLRSAPLSVAERLQAEEMGKLLNLYKGKENWTVREVNGLNDVCAALLKLSAKYAV